MPSPIPGTVVQAETPSWAALEAAVGVVVAPGFMWMFEIRLADGTRVDAYKHVASRRYLHLTEDARALIYRGECGYVQTHLGQAVAEMLRGTAVSGQPISASTFVVADGQAGGGR